MSHWNLSRQEVTGRFYNLLAVGNDGRCPKWVISRHPGNVRRESALPLKADIERRGEHVRLVPILLRK